MSSVMSAVLPVLPGEKSDLLNWRTCSPSGCTFDFQKRSNTAKTCDTTSAMSDRPLTEKQQRFIEEYLVDLNAKQAAIRAGYSEKGAEVTGSKLLANPKVSAAVSTARDQQSQRTLIEADRVIKELAVTALSDLGEVMDFSGDTLRMRPASQIPENARRAISSIKVKRRIEGEGEDAREVEVIEFRMYDKLSALDKLAKHLGLYPGGKHPKKVDVTSGGKPIEKEAIETTVNRFAAAIGTILAGTGTGLPAPHGDAESVDTTGEEGRPVE